jgi:Asp-tRNA(Asn)/Glu-tRNA(Gln) amidotransferase A subunit family amidase
MTDLETAVGMAAAVAAGEVSPVELVQRALSRVQVWQDPTNAFTQLMFGAGLEEARRIERAVADGEPAGPLAGVPVAVKDLFDVAGQETTGCSLAYQGNIATSDAAVVRRLKEAGAIVVGKTNMHELAAGATNLVSACGPTSNPWDLDRITGGSSGGSGAAVAAGVVPIALGSDTGGSIRIPSSFCGIGGLKPTHGALPLDGVMPLAPSMDCPGPMAGSIADVRLAWDVLARTGVEPHSPPERPARAGVLGGWFLDRIQPEVVEGVRAAAGTLERLGVSVEPVDGSGLDDALHAWTDFAWSQFADLYGHLLERPDLVDPLTRSYLQHGAALSAEQRMAARRRAEEVGAWFAERLRGVDVLVAPSTPFPAPPADSDEVQIRDGVYLGIHRGGPSALTRPVNLAGLPALAVPSGLSGDGLPLGIQLIAARRRERLLLDTAELLGEEDSRFRPMRAPYPPPGLEPRAGLG